MFAWNSAAELHGMETDSLRNVGDACDVDRAASVRRMFRWSLQRCRGRRRPRLDMIVSDHRFSPATSP